MYIDYALSKLVDILQEVYKNNKLMEEVVGITISFNSSLEGKLEELIMDMVGIPEDTTTTLGVERPDVFCRDYFYDWIVNYYEIVN